MYNGYIVIRVCLISGAQTISSVLICKKPIFASSMFLFIISTLINRVILKFLLLYLCAIIVYIFKYFLLIMHRNFFLFKFFFYFLNFYHGI